MTQMCIDFVTETPRPFADYGDVPDDMLERMLAERRSSAACHEAPAFSERYHAASRAVRGPQLVGHLQMEKKPYYRAGVPHLREKGVLNDVVKNSPWGMSQFKQ